ncbi:hypothetical protein [Bradyrhizobium sp. AZCC 2230]|uniref:hypothetical protein n=1 Tax=Bradyrhizobium sp. AZCC 2230 TaxID=3117021 RepID=UPI002FEE8508
MARAAPFRCQRITRWTLARLEPVYSLDAGLTSAEHIVQIKLPRKDLKFVQSIDSIELKDAAGRHIGQYFFGKNYGRTVFLFGKYKGTFKTHEECQAFVDGVLAVVNS